jgi:hypothetical protein
MTCTQRAHGGTHVADKKQGISRAYRSLPGGDLAQSFQSLCANMAELVRVEPDDMRREIVKKLEITRLVREDEAEPAPRPDGEGDQQPLWWNK